MSIIFSYHFLYKSYGGKPLFSDISFDLLENEHLGLIGANGSGKSTLLKIIAGKEDADQGTKYLKKYAKLVYLAQEDKFTADKTIEEIIFEVLESLDIEDVERYQRVTYALSIGGFHDKNQLCSQLSGGWKKRLAIVRALSLKPDLLLLDEPTNHLDINGIIWLENILKTKSFAFVVVSHDRCFLENIAERTIEIGQCYPDGYFSVKGGYNKFVKNKLKFIEEQSKKEKILSNKMKRENQWLQQGAKARSTKAKYRINQAEQMRLSLYALKRQNRHTNTVSIGFNATGRKTKKLLTMINISKSIKTKTGTKTLFEKINVKLLPGSKLGLLGENGSGKTTFMNILENIIEPDEGKIERADKLKISVFDQDRSKLDQEISLKKALCPSGDSVLYCGKTVHVISWAQRFLFTRDQLELPVGHLSGGEQARILIANLMLQQADILLLDEPTNDLDIASLEVLEESLLEFSGAVVLVSHDRFLLNRVTNSILYLDGRTGTKLFADYSQFLKRKEPKKKQNLNTIKTDNNIKKHKKKKKDEKKIITFSYKDKFELEQIEDKISNSEFEVNKLQDMVADPNISANPEELHKYCIMLEKSQKKAEYLYNRWEELESLKSKSK